MVSSNKLERRKPDRLTKKAKELGYAARSVFKLEEIDKKYRLLRPGAQVLDLGCAPGSWSRYAGRAVGAGGRVLGVDITAMNAPGPNVTVIRASIFDVETDERLRPPQGFDAVLSDMAPSTTGVKDVDEARSLELSQAAWRVAEAALRPGGCFLCKVFQGPDTKPWVDGLRRRFTRVEQLRPDAVRKNSREIYVLGLGFRG